MTCCLMGHRQVPERLQPILLHTLELCINEGKVSEFLVGNQGAFDRMAFSVLKVLHKMYPHIHYVRVLAYRPDNSAINRDIAWQESYFPEELATVHPRYAISHRNRWMVRNSDCIVAYITHKFGGAYQFVEQGRRQGKEIINLAELDLGLK